MRMFSFVAASTYAVACAVFAANAVTRGVAIVCGFQCLTWCADKRPIRMYDADKVLKFCQGYIARNMGNESQVSHD